MRVHTLYREQLLNISLEEAWFFFSSPHNLSKITPPEMGFKILTEGLEEIISDGMIIDYEVKPALNVAVNWTTEISNVSAPYKFTDIQIKGPYRLWEHEHRFEHTSTGVKIIDQVRYALPFEILGTFLHFIFVKRRLRYIFRYRENKLNELFN